MGSDNRIGYFSVVNVMRGFRFIIWGLLLLVGMSSCVKEKSPTSLIPTFIVSEVTDVTRNSARVDCEVEVNGTETVTDICCFYGTSLEMEKRMDCNGELPDVSVSFRNLNAGTTYYFCFEVSNGCGTVRSSVYSFVTDPEQAPLLGELQMKGRGPTSVILQFNLLDDGGKSLLETGFYVWREGGDEEKILVDELDSIVYTRLSELELQTDYVMQGFAINDLGETRTEGISFRTTQAVIVMKAGTLNDLIDDEERFRFSDLAVSGSLNGTDFQVIREMLGCNVDGLLTPGRMEFLDLTDAKIVAGGNSYDGSHYTCENIISNGLFADCLFLKNVKLPYGTIEIERGAFDNCLELDSLYIPANTINVMPSRDCRNLKYIDTSNEHVKYANYEGCLYSKDYTVLYWYPMGKVQETIIFPKQLERIEAYAFQQVQQKEIIIPNTVKDLGVGAFYGSSLESVYVSDGVTLIPTAAFQSSKNLSSIRLGVETSYLSAYSFDGCPLRHLFVPVKDFPPVCHDDAFKGVENVYEDCVLHVPVGYKNLYKNAAPWKNFKRIMDDIQI